MIAKATTLLLALMLSACSLQNREGPNVTCADLEDGAINACSEGIIATCEKGSMTWQACESDDVCDEAWQTPNKYRCNSTDAAPSLEADPSNTGTGGVRLTGSGGSSTGGESPGGNSSGGGPSTAGSSTGSGGESDCTVCPVASTGSLRVDAYVLDDANVYFSDCETLWSVPKSGGFPTELSSELENCSLGRIKVDDAYVYLLEDEAPEKIVRIPKTGGAREVTVSVALEIDAFAVDDDSVYWVEGFDINAAAKKGGGVDTFVAGASFRGPGLVVQDGYLYWLQSYSIARASTSADRPVEPSSLPLDTGADDLAIGQNSVFLVDASGTVSRVSLVDGSTAVLASDQPSPGAVTVDEQFVYWSSTGGIPEIRKVSQEGGTPQLVAKATYAQSSIGRIRVDAAHIYWAEGSKIMRAPK